MLQNQRQDDLPASTKDYASTTCHWTSPFFQNQYGIPSFPRKPEMPIEASTIISIQGIGSRILIRAPMLSFHGINKSFNKYIT